jgi:hypothetical protein
MQLFWDRKKQTESPEDFWRHTGEKRGGEVGFVTFATFLGQSGDRVLGFPGLLYTVGETVWFEDFEKDNWLARIIGGRQKYEKTELRFLVSETTFTRVISRRSAYRCIGGARDPKDLPPLSPFLRMFSTSVVQIGMKSGSSLFMEIMRQKEFLDLLAGKTPPKTASE